MHKKAGFLPRRDEFRTAFRRQIWVKDNACPIEKVSINMIRPSYAESQGDATTLILPATGTILKRLLRSA